MSADSAAGDHRKSLSLYLQHQHYPLGCALDYSFAALNLFTQYLSLISAANCSVPLTQPASNRKTVYLLNRSLC